MDQQIEEMFTVALIMMTACMAIFVLTLIFEYETTPMGLGIHIVVLIALSIVFFMASDEELKRIKARREKRLKEDEKE